MEFENLKIDSKNKMEKTISILNETLVKIRSGRPHPSMLDGVNVDYYGNPSPISQVANVSLVDARTLGVSPWEKSMLPQIEKAIRDSDLGLNPISLGDIIRVPMPPLSEERRKELLKVVKNEIESSKVVIRNIRRDSNSFLKDLEKKKQISIDQERKMAEEIQKITDQYVSLIDDIFSKKESDLMSI